MADLWSGRLPGGLDPAVRAFSASLAVDWRLAPYDIRGSLAHVAMLAHVGLLDPTEQAVLERGLRELLAEVDAGAAPWDPEAEDVHSAVEAELSRRVGPVAGKLHTGRRRHDQVALDLHLFVRDACERTQAAVRDLVAALVDGAEAHRELLMPAYTHLQRAQPVTVAHWFLAYAWMFRRDATRLADARHRADFSPLGAGALAGSTLPLDPAFTAGALGFAGPYANSLDAVSDRDFAVEYVAAAALIMVHLSRLAEDLVLWNTREFGFIEIDDGWATGSSMMPQKKNPDVAELIRGRAGRVFGDLAALLTLLKGLPLSYNRDLQEDKPALFDAADTVLACLEAAAGLVRHIRWRPDALSRALSAELLATDDAERLVRQGIPFRDAHGRVAARFRDGGTEPADPEAVRGSVAARGGLGPAPAAVMGQIAALRDWLAHPL
jgi:argininosuccinate lyase